MIWRGTAILPSNLPNVFNGVRIFENPFPNHSIALPNLSIIPVFWIFPKTLAMDSKPLSPASITLPLFSVIQVPALPSFESARAALTPVNFSPTVPAVPLIDWIVDLTILLVASPIALAVWTGPDSVIDVPIILVSWPKPLASPLILPHGRLEASSANLSSRLCFIISPSSLGVFGSSNLLSISFARLTSVIISFKDFGL